MRLAWVLGSFLLIVSAVPSRAATLRVPDDHSTIQSAIDAAATGDTVLVACGTYPDRGVQISRSIVLRGNPDAPGCVTLDAVEADRFITVQADVKIEGFTFKNGTAPNTRGGAIRFLSGVSDVADCHFIGNRGDRGGAVLVEATATATMARCRFDQNGTLGTGGVGGAILSESMSTVRIMDCEFVSNTAGWRGGAVAAFREAGTYPLSIEMVGCSFQSHTAFEGGTIAAYVSSTDLTLRDCELLDSFANESGGGIFAVSNGGNLVLDGCPGSSATGRKLAAERSSWPMEMQ